MAIAQMNWGRMKFPLEDSRMAEFADALDRVYREAEDYPGFIWRIDDAQAASQLSELGHNELTSATVSVWSDVEALRAYTFETEHGVFLQRARDWFEIVDGPQLVIWPVGDDERPTFLDAFDRLAHLKKYGPSKDAHGWDIPNA